MKRLILFHLLSQNQLSQRDQALKDRLVWEQTDEYQNKSQIKAHELPEAQNEALRLVETLDNSTMWLIQKIMESKVMAKSKIKPADNNANMQNPNKGSSGTNRQHDQNQGNRGKQLNPNQKKKK